MNEIKTTPMNEMKPFLLDFSVLYISWFFRSYILESFLQIFAKFSYMLKILKRKTLYVVVGQ